MRMIFAMYHYVGNRLMENAFLSMGHNLSIDYSDTVEQHYVHMHAPEPTRYTGCNSLLVANVVFHRISKIIIFSEICDNSGRCV